MSVAGGFGDFKAYLPGQDPTVDGLLTEAIKAEMNKTAAGEVKIVSYATQVVAGTNYVLKLLIADNEFTAKIHVPLPHTGGEPELMEFAKAA